MQISYVARQAILDRNNQTVGYELLFRDSPENQFPEIDQDIASSKLIIQNHFQGDIQAVCLGKLAYINFTEKCLINKYPLMFNKDTIVIELVGHKTANARLLKIVQFYYQKGYKIALTEYDLDEKWDVLFPYIAMIKVDIEVINAKRLRPVVARIKPFDIKLIAEKVETNFQLQSLAEVGFNYYQVGRQTGKVVTQILNGTSPQEIPVQGIKETELFVNPKAATRMGLTLDEKIIARAKEVIE